jgi:hypothetical protein
VNGAIVITKTPQLGGTEGVDIKTYICYTIGDNQLRRKGGF